MLVGLKRTEQMHKNVKIILNAIPTADVSVKDTVKYRTYTITTSDGVQVDIKMENSVLQQHLSNKIKGSEIPAIVTACEKRIIELYRQQTK